MILLWLRSYPTSEKNKPKQSKRPSCRSYEVRHPRGVSADIWRAAEILRAGGLVAFPTETVYGLGADASSAKAMARLYEVKGRPADHPVIVHLRSADLAFQYGREVHEND